MANGGFVPTMYWSSSEVQRNNPWGVVFTNGDGKYPNKNDTLTRTRCIRTLTPPPAAPSGYGVAWTSDLGVLSNMGAASFQITGAEVGAVFSYSITSSGGAGNVRGAGVATSATQSVSGLDLWVLPDGILTLSLLLTNAGGSGAAATASAEKAPFAPIDCTDTGVLATAPNGSRCADGSIFAASLNGTYLITHISGCGHEPAGTSTTKAAASFTPTCTGGTDSITKRWANTTGVTEGAASLTDGMANTEQLLADALRLNPAAAYCHHMNLNGRTDWYLPAIQELHLLSENRTAIGGFPHLPILVIL